jgi:hypothetical protein
MEKGHEQVSRVRKGNRMQDELLDKDNLSVRRAKSIFEGAFYECEIDEDGDLRITDDVVVLMISSGESILKFLTLFRFKEDADEYRALELEHRINDAMMCVKAVASLSHRCLSISWFVNVEGGITPRNLVLTFRKFQKYVRQVELCDDDDLLE